MPNCGNLPRLRGATEGFSQEKDRKREREGQAGSRDGTEGRGSVQATTN